MPTLCALSCALQDYDHDIQSYALDCYSRMLAIGKAVIMVNAGLRLEPSLACGRNPILVNRNCQHGIECRLLGLPLVYIVAKMESRQRRYSIVISE